MEQPKNVVMVMESDQIGGRKEKTKFKKIFIFYLCFMFMILIIKGITDLYSYATTSPETRELHSLQNEASQIKKDATDLRKRIAGFNKKIDEIMTTREMYPTTEPIPSKVNPCKILAEKEAP